jgi:hypothetical protein
VASCPELIEFYCMENCFWWDIGRDGRKCYSESIRCPRARLIRSLASGESPKSGAADESMRRIALLMKSVCL